MNLRDYIANVEKTFKFQIKTLFPLEAPQMDLLEKALQKYRPSSISKPKKTMFQSNPLGFTGVKNSEVYIVNVELTVPVTELMLQFDLREVLHLGKDSKELMVFSEVGSELAETSEPMSDEDADKKDKTALLSNDHYEEVEEASFDDNFGAAYNEKFLSYLKKVESERKVARRQGEVDAKHPITKWANQPKAEPSASDYTQPKG